MAFWNIDALGWRNIVFFAGAIVVLVSLLVLAERSTKWMRKRAERKRR